MYKYYARVSTEDQNLAIQQHALKQAGRRKIFQEKGLHLGTDKIGAGLKSLSDPWANTTPPAGRMVLTVFPGIAEFERELIRERTGAGRTAAMKRGVHFGRRASLSTEQAGLGIPIAKRLRDKRKSVKEVAKTFGVNRSRGPTINGPESWTPSTIYRTTAA